MRIIFFIAALIGAVYLVLQTPAGQAWLTTSESLMASDLTATELKSAPQVNESSPSQQAEPLSQQVTQVADNLENKMSEFIQRLNQQQQGQIDQLENRVADLKNELIMSRIAQNQPMADTTEQPEIEPESQTLTHEYATLPKPQGITLGVASVDDQTPTTGKQMQRQRQARLQDIAEKMEMSSLQALLN